MRPAAQLERHATNVYDADHVAILLAEQGHRARRDRVFIGHLAGLDRQILPHVRIDLGFDGGELVALDRAVMAEIEPRSEEHTSELQSRLHLVCRLLLEKKKK